MEDTELKRLEEELHQMTPPQSRNNDNGNRTTRQPAKTEVVNVGVASNRLQQQSSDSIDLSQEQVVAAQQQEWDEDQKHLNNRSPIISGAATNSDQNQYISNSILPEIERKSQAIIELSLLDQGATRKKTKQTDDSKKERTPPTQSSFKLYTDYASLHQLAEKQELRRQKDEAEKERLRRSRLIFGCESMISKIKKKKMTPDKLHIPKNSVLDTEASTVTDRKESSFLCKTQVKSWKELFFLDPETRFMQVFETYMMLIIGYSCFTSAYYVAFSFPEGNNLLLWLEHIVFVSYGIDIIFNFMRLPSQDEIGSSAQQQANRRSHLYIAKRYVISHRFILDFTATFPFYMISNDGSWLKLLRMTRLPKILNLVDQKRFFKLIEIIVRGLPNDKRILYKIRIKQGFSIMRLMLITIILTYFIGCGFYYVASLPWNLNSEPNFQSQLDQKKKEDPGWSEDTDIEFYDFISVIYFSMTTLSTVGFGDITAKSNLEKLTAIVVMFSGVGFFSYIMGNFISIIQSFNEDFTAYDRTFELNNWMKLVTRYRNNQPLPDSLMKQIHGHFKYLWLNDRIRQVERDNELISELPQSIKRAIIVHFLFDDIFYNFRSFFKPEKYKDSKFLYDVAYGLTPRYFSQKEDENIIYDEQEEVLEIYFVQTGTVSVGYHLYDQPLEKPRYTLVKNLEQNACFGDYYLCNGLNAEFLYVAVSKIEAFSLSQKFLMGKIFPKYPDIYEEIKDSSKYAYNGLIKYELVKHKTLHLQYVNKSNTYQEMNLKPKVYANDQDDQDPLVITRRCEIDEYEGYKTSIRFRDRLKRIGQEVQRIRGNLNDQMQEMTHDFQKVVHSSGTMSLTLGHLKQMNKKTKIELNSLQRGNNQAFDLTEDSENLMLSSPIRRISSFKQ